MVNYKLPQPFSKSVVNPLTGETNLVSDFSGENEAKIIWKPKRKVIIRRSIINLATSRNMDILQFGAGDELENGIDAFVVRGDGLIYKLNDDPIKTNFDFKKYCYDVSLTDWAGDGDQTLSCRWTFSKYSEGIILDPDNGDFIELDLKDDFTLTNRRLLDFEIVLQGEYLSK